MRRVCEACGSELPPRARSNQRYCDSYCRLHGKTVQMPPGKLGECACPGCHRPIPPGSRADRKYCSDSCKHKAKRLKAKPRPLYYVCHYCDRQYVPRHPNQRYCKSTCRSRARWHRRPKVYKRRSNAKALKWKRENKSYMAFYQRQMRKRGARPAEPDRLQSAYRALFGR